MLRIFLALSLITFLSLSPAQAQLDADFSAGGAIRIGESTTTCNAAAEGGIRYRTLCKSLK